MSKTKNKTSWFIKLVQSDKLTALAVVVLCTSFGTAFLPRIFAATNNNFTTNLKAAPQNDSEYTVILTWDGNTEHEWKGRTFLGGQFVDNWTSKNKTKFRKNLACGRSHRFDVAPMGENGGLKAEWTSVYATAPCPGVSFDSMSASGNNISIKWSPRGPTQSYFLGIKKGSGAFNRIETTSTSYTLSNESCGTTFQAYVQPSAGNQTGVQSLTKSATTSDCPSTGGNSGGGGSSGGGSGGGSSGGSSSSGGGSGSSGGGGSSSGGGRGAEPYSSGSSGGSATSGDKVTVPKATKPATFNASVIASKVVSLEWSASQNADHYLVRRSTDQQNWTEISNTKRLAVTDRNTEFATTYFYSVVAVAENGVASDAALTQITTEEFTASSSTVTSDDGLVTVSIPDGTIPGEYDCSVSRGDSSQIRAGDGQTVVVGPYELLCVTAEGEIIGSFNQPVSVVINTQEVRDGFSDTNVRVVGSDDWNRLEAEFVEESGRFSFTMANSKEFAVFGSKQGSALGAFMKVLLVLLVIGAMVGIFLWWRRRQSGYDDYGFAASSAPKVTTSDTPSAAVAAAPTAEDSFKEALAKPDCTHLNEAQQVVPSSQTCDECSVEHTTFNALRICLVCGHVGCSDDSPEQHAMKHFNETGHPIMYEFGNPNGNTIGWCYIDQTYI